MTGLGLPRRFESQPRSQYFYQYFMENFKMIEQLPEKKLWKLISEEPAFICGMNPEDPIDVKRYMEMERQEDVKRWMEEVDEEPETEDIKKYFESHQKEIMLYSVSGEKGEGEADGWVMLMPEEKERIERINKTGLANLPKEDYIMELSFARRSDPDMPDKEREKGLVSSGVRQICYSLGLALHKEEKEKEETKRPFLNPNLKIVAYTNPENKPSEMVLEKSGFEMKGKVKYEPNSEKENNLWVLDWKKLADYYAKKDESWAEKYE